MAAEKTESVGLLCIFQLLVLLRTNEPVDSEAAVDPCQPQFLCIVGTRMGDQNNCRRYYECRYDEERYPYYPTRYRSKRFANLGNEMEKPRWVPRMCHDRNFSTIESECVRNSTDQCQKKCEDLYCPKVLDEKQSRTWNITKAGTTSIQECITYDRCSRGKPLQEHAGMCSKQCALNADGPAVWLSSNCDECVDPTYVDLMQKIESPEAGSRFGDQRALASISTKLANLTNDTGGLTIGHLNASLNVIRRLTSLRRENPNIAPSKEEVRSIVEAISNLLEPINVDPWKCLHTKNATNCAMFLSSADVYGQKLAKLINKTESKTVSVISNNMVLEARSFDQISSAKTDAVSFSFDRNGQGEDWSTLRGDIISISGKSLNQICSVTNVVNVWSSCFRNIENCLPVANGTDVIGSRVISLSVESSRDIESLSQPINISFQHGQINGNRLKKCVYWKFDASSGNGYWDDDGCWLISTNDTHTFCQCNRLANFAVLFRLSPSEDVVLSMISKIGCCISIAALTLTVIVYAFSWKNVESDQATLLLNLCVALIVANTVFLVGAGKTSDQHVCIAVAVLLHYFFLAAFFLMLAEGFQLLLSVFCNCHERCKILIIALGWVLPLIGVAVLLGIKKTSVYINSQSCWLSVENGLIWAFVGPPLLIILINLLIAICVKKKSRVSGDRGRDPPSEKEKMKNKIRASMKNLVVVCPVLGIAWVFGVLSVSYNHIVFQYLFAITKGSEGMSVFIVNVLLRRKKGGKGNLILDLIWSVCRESTSSPSVSLDRTQQRRR